MERPCLQKVVEGCGPWSVLVESYHGAKKGFARACSLEGEEFQWQSPSLSAVDMPPVELAKACLVAVTKKSLVLLVRQEVQMKGVIFHMCKVLLEVLEARRPGEGISTQPVFQSTLDELVMILQAVVTLCDEGLCYPQALQKLLAVKANGPARLLAQALTQNPHFQQAAKTLQQTQAAATKLTPVMAKHCEGFPEASPEGTMVVLSELHGWRDALRKGVSDSREEHPPTWPWKATTANMGNWNWRLASWL